MGPCWLHSRTHDEAQLCSRSELRRQTELLCCQELVFGNRIFAWSKRRAVYYWPGVELSKEFGQDLEVSLFWQK